MREEDISEDWKFAYKVRDEVMAIGYYRGFDAFDYVNRRFAERKAEKKAAAKRMARERVCPLPWVRRDV